MCRDEGLLVKQIELFAAIDFGQIEFATEKLVMENKLNAYAKVLAKNRYNLNKFSIRK